MSKFQCKGGVFEIPKKKIDKWDLKYGTKLSVWQVTWFQLYDLTIWFDNDGKLWVVFDYSDGTGYRAGVEPDINEWATNALTNYRSHRVISRQDLRRELQGRIAKRALAYMDNVLAGRDNYDD